MRIKDLSFRTDDMDRSRESDLKHKFLLITAIAFFMVFFLCAFSLQKTSLVMDTEKYPVYLAVADDDMPFDSQDEGKFVTLQGETVSVKKDGTQAELDINGETLSVSFNKKELKEKAKKLSSGDTVRIYGKLKRTGIFDRTLELEASEMEEKSEIPESALVVRPDSVLSPMELSGRYLREGRVYFEIPADWTGREHDLISEGLGAIEGYHYDLQTSEHLFVAYFGNELLETENDRNRKTQIEKAVASNILKSDVTGTFPLATRKTAYKAQYDYYQAPYRVGGIEGYSTEFIFEADGNEGFVICLYIYRTNERKNLPKIMTMLSTLEIRE